MEDKELREKAKIFAKDFGIDLQKYPRIKIGKNTVVFRAEHNANGSGGWSEGEPGLSIPKFIVDKYGINAPYITKTWLRGRIKTLQSKL